MPRRLYAGDAECVVLGVIMMMVKISYLNCDDSDIYLAVDN